MSESEFPTEELGVSLAHDKRCACADPAAHRLVWTNWKLIQTEAALEHAERALSDKEGSFASLADRVNTWLREIHLDDEQITNWEPSSIGNALDELGYAHNRMQVERDILRTCLAEAESERDHASMQAGINADLVYKAEQRGRALEDAIRSALVAPYDSKAMRILTASLTPPPGQLASNMETREAWRALLAVARAVHPMFSQTANEYGACGICHRITHPSGCDCPVAKLDASYPDWRAEWRHGRPHDTRMAEDHDEA